MTTKASNRITSYMGLLHISLDCFEPGGCKMIFQCVLAMDIVGLVLISGMDLFID